MSDASSDPLPPWRRVLAVVAHPDDESFGLGAIIAAFVDAGAHVGVLCLTAGEASTLGASPELASVRAAELDAAARRLGCGETTLLVHPDGDLAARASELLRDVAAAVDRAAPDGLLVFAPAGGVSGHPDHEAASRAALAVAHDRGLPVLEWGLPDDIAATLNAEFGTAFAAHGTDGVPLEVAVDRTRQLEAVHEHATQAVPGSVLWRRLELQADREYLRLVAAP